MKKMILSAAVLLIFTACSQQPQEKQQLPLDSDKAKLGYAMGMDVGKSFGQIADDIDVEAFVEGFRTSFAKGEARMTVAQANGVKQAFFMERKKKQQAKFAAEGEANRKAGEAFLAANKQKEGVTTTASGLQYEVLRAADGPKPTLNDNVEVDYKGTLIDGTVFDSSYERGKSAVIPLNRMIKGWVEGLPLMSVGSKYRFYVPSDLAYGPIGAPPKIGPNAALIFEVELHTINPESAIKQPVAKPADKPAAK